MSILVVGFLLGLLVLAVMAVFGLVVDGTTVEGAFPPTGSRTSTSLVRFLTAFIWITRAIPRIGRALVALSALTLVVAIQIIFNLYRLGTIYFVRTCQASPLLGAITTPSRHTAPTATFSTSRTRAIGRPADVGAGRVSVRGAGPGIALGLL
jgi:hypothetical protein